MNVEFYLHNGQDRKGLSLIYAHYTHGGKKYRFSTGMKVEPKHWNVKKRFIRESHPQAGFIRVRLDGIRKKVMDCALSILAADLPPDTVRIRECLKGTGQKVTIAEAWRDFERTKVGRLSPSTQENYENTYRVLCHFLESTGAGWEVFTYAFPDRFISFLEKERGNLANTGRRRLRVLKVFLKHCEKAGFIASQEWKDWKIGIKKDMREEVYLTWEELNRLKNHQPDSRGWEQTRDVFIFLCHTGMRYSESQTLSPDMLEGDCLRFRIHKGGKMGEIRLSPTAQQIFQRYGGKWKLSTAEFNRRLKKLGESAGIHARVTDRDGTQVEKFRMISSHTGRRTFITLLLQSGVDIQSVRRLVGHSDIGITAQYDKRGSADFYRYITEVFG